MPQHRETGGRDGGSYGIVLLLQRPFLLPVIDTCHQNKVHRPVLAQSGLLLPLSPYVVSNCHLPNLYD